MAKLKLSVLGDHDGLVILMFHGIYPSALSLANDEFDPHHPVWLNDFECVVSELSKNNYDFVSEADILAGLPASGRQVWVTFDDGYANNLAVIPLLEKYGVKATIFVSAGHIRDGRAFWWDALWRKGRAGNVPVPQIRQQANALKAEPYDRIEQILAGRFGDAAMYATGEYDRPMSVAELKSVARHPLVTIGNHTINHAILTVLSPQEASRQISGCQEMVEEWTGRRPVSIAYPNGRYSGEILEMCAESGLRLGVTTAISLRSPVAPGQNNLLLPRTSVSSAAAILPQIDILRAGVKASAAFRYSVPGAVPGARA